MMPSRFRIYVRQWAALAALAAALPAGACAVGQTMGRDPRAMRFPAPVFAPPSPSRRVLAGGLVVYLLADHELPLVEGKALIKTGSVYDPPGRTGTARLFGRAMVSGGTEKLPGRRLQEALEAKAVRMSGEAAGQSASVSFSALSAHLPLALEALADVLRRPAYDPQATALEKARLKEEIRRLADDPDGLAFREFRRLLYGDDPRGRSAAPEEVEAVSRDGLVEFHRCWVSPERVILGFSGDFDAAELLGRLEVLFGDWRPSECARPPYPVPRAEAADHRRNLFIKDLPQTTLVMGHLAPPKDSHDYVPFMVADHILGGGGFTSRLTGEIRSNRGLAYSAGSFYRGDIGYGVFVASAKTKNSAAAEVMGLMADLAAKLKNEGVSAAETEAAGEALGNALIFRFDSPSAIVAEALALEHEGLPADFTMRLAGRLAAVTAHEVNEAAARWLDPSRATVVVLGGPEAIELPWPNDRPWSIFQVRSDGGVVLDANSAE